MIVTNFELGIIIIVLIFTLRYLWSDAHGSTVNIQRVNHNFTDHRDASIIMNRLDYVNKTLIAHLQSVDDSEYVDFLDNNYKNASLREHNPKNKTTSSFVVNKGEEFNLCLREQSSGELHDYNTLLFVNLHELAHLYDKKIGHNESFWQGFEYILYEAQKIGLYTPIDYSKTPTHYCGTTITHNPYF